MGLMAASQPSIRNGWLAFLGWEWGFNVSGKMVFLKQGSIAKRLPTFYLETIYIKQSQRKNSAL